MSVQSLNAPRLANKPGGHSIYEVPAGFIAEVAIDSLLALPYSMDYDFVVFEDNVGHWFHDNAWHEVRGDWYYPTLIRDLEYGGLEYPVTVVTDDYYDPTGTQPLAFVDGHHRLAAAYELGWATILTMNCGLWSTSQSIAVREDSGGTWGERLEITRPNEIIEPFRL